MFDNKGSTHRETQQVEAPTNAFDALIELYKCKHDIVLRYINTTDDVTVKRASEVLDRMDEDILHLKLIAADQFDYESLEEETC